MKNREETLKELNLVVNEVLKTQNKLNLSSKPKILKR